MVSGLLMGSYWTQLGKRSGASGIMATNAFYKSELPLGRLDREYPHQVAFHAGYIRSNADDLLIQRFCEHRNITPRHHTVRRGDKDFIVYCFKDPQHADSFRAAFGGEFFLGARQKPAMLPPTASDKRIRAAFTWSGQLTA